MCDVRSHYVTLLNDVGVVAPDYRSVHLKARLRQCFGEKILFVRTSVSEPELVVSAEVPHEILFRAACLSVDSTDRLYDQYADEEVGTSYKPLDPHPDHQSFSMLLCYFVESS